ncbi:MAG: site-2 protease family protein [Clostridia bacterium]|nr:site-2 protease family protein [Clostridia bacterium]
MTSSGVVYWIFWLLAAFLAALCVFVPHYFAHAYVAYKCGDYTPKAYGRVTLNPMKHLDVVGFIMMVLVGFGWGKPMEVNPSNFRHYRRGLFFYGVAGMVMNYILGLLSFLLFSVVYKYMSPSYIRDFLYLFFGMMYSRNMYLFVINLLPIVPLDGFLVVEACTKPWNKFRQFGQKYGQIIFMVLIIECFACNIIEAYVPAVGYANILGYVSYAATRYVGYPIMALWGLVIPI